MPLFIIMIMEWDCKILNSRKTVKLFEVVNVKSEFSNKIGKGSCDFTVIIQILHN